MNYCYVCGPTEYRNTFRKAKGELIYVGKGLYRERNCNPNNHKGVDNGQGKVKVASI